MEINMALLLPRDARTVPVARHICREALRELGVDADCVADIEVALTEACTNVLEHSRAGEEYEVQVELAERDCVIRVVDRGQGFDADAPAPRADDTAESGRGIALMRALVDHVKFESRPRDGTVVRLEKQLLYADGAPVTGLSVWRQEGGSR
ncbi:MAG: ATP-binding protein [Acidimicrobiales bacterium]